MFRPNRLKEKLARGEKAVGCWVFFDSADSMELLSMCGFDAAIVDHEHIAASVRSLVDLMRAAQATDMTVLARVPSHDPVYIKRVMDAGIEGIVVPTLETAEEARAIVAACRYRPHGGHRGVGYPEARAANWGMAEVEYPKAYRERFLIAAIVETKRGMENLPELLQVEGLDLVFPGAGDLAADLIADFDKLGSYGGYSDPELLRLLAGAEAQIKASNAVHLGGVARHGAHARALFEKGYGFVTATSDGWLIMDGARAAIREALGR